MYHLRRSHAKRQNGGLQAHGRGLFGVCIGSRAQSLRLRVCRSDQRGSEGTYYLGTYYLGTYYLGTYYLGTFNKVQGVNEKSEAAPDDGATPKL